MRAKARDTTMRIRTAFDSDSRDTRVVSGAAANGYRNGRELGAFARNTGARRAQPQTLAVYRLALEGWEPKFGSRASYKLTFRKSFVDGYDDGFTGREPESLDRRK